MSTTLAAVPARSTEQRLQALDRANAIRTYRAQLKLELKAGRADVLTVLASGDELLATMKIFDLLLAAPKIGRVKADAILRRTRISPSKTVGGLTERQRTELVAALRHGLARPTLFEAPRPPRADRRHCTRCRVWLRQPSDDGLCGFCADEATAA